MNEQEFNETIKTMSAQIVTLSRRLQEAETKLGDISKMCLTYSKLAEHAMTCKPNEVKADLLELTSKFDKMQTSLATGRGRIQPQNMLKPEDFVAVREKRIAQASLAEVAEFIEGK